jgi:hypothetical protein
MVKTSSISRDDDDIRFVLDQHPYCGWIFKYASSLEQQSKGGHFAPV